MVQKWPPGEERNKSLAAFVIFQWGLLGADKAACRTRGPGRGVLPVLTWPFFPALASGFSLMML